MSDPIELAPSRCSVCSHRVCEDCSLYVVFDPHRLVVKIGMSNKPVRRYGQHRKKVGTHVLLVEHYIAGCRFVTSKREAVALAEMDAAFLRFNGDWFLASSQDGVEAVIAALATEVRV